MEDMIGRLAGLCSHDPIVALIETLGRKVRAEIAIAAVETA